MKKKRKSIYILCGILAAVLIFVLYLCLHEPDIPVKTWTPDENFSIDSDQRVLIESSELHFLDISPYKNPETVQLRDGWIYAAVDGGSIIRLREDGTGLEQVLSTEGYILGFDIDASGDLYFCDCSFRKEPAICKYDGNAVERLSVRGLTYPDALCISADGETLYYTNASCVSPAKRSCDPQTAYMIDMMGHTKTESVWSYDLRTGEQRLLADGLCFANGVQLAENETCLLVNETSENRIWRVDLAGGEKEVLLTVPGYPDNLHAAEDGYWTGFAGLYAPAYAKLADKPLLRRIVLNLPQFVLSSVSGGASGKDAVFIKYDADGKVLRYHAVEGIGFTTTGAVETDRRVYLETIGNVSRIYYYKKTGGNENRPNIKQKQEVSS